MPQLDKPTTPEIEKPGPQQAYYAANLATVPTYRAVNNSTLRDDSRIKNLANWSLDKMEASNARQYENPALRWTSDLNEGSLLGTALDIGSGFGPKPQDAIDRTMAAYKKHIAPYEETQRASKIPDERMSPYRAWIAAMMSDSDKDVAMHTFNRKEHPYHYALNPYVRTGPLKEVGERLNRRSLARLADLGAGPAAFRAWVPGSLAIPSMLEGKDSAKDRRARVRSMLDREIADPQPAVDEKKTKKKEEKKASVIDYVIKQANTKRSPVPLTIQIILNS